MHFHTATNKKTRIAGEPFLALFIALKRTINVFFKYNIVLIFILEFAGLFIQFF